MRIVGLLSMTALILTGLPPAPIAPASAAAQPRGARIARPPRPDDPDARCAPFLQGGGDYDDYGRPAMAAAAAIGGNGGAALRAPPCRRRRLRRRRRRRRREARANADGSVAVTGERIQRQNQSSPHAGRRHRPDQAIASRATCRRPKIASAMPGEAVAAVQAVADTPVSTFSVDVDTGSYSNVRRMLNAGADAAAGRGPHRGDAQLFPLRLSGAAGPLAAVQRPRPT